jgi:arginine/lysine/ornithine decarboxylase
LELFFNSVKKYCNSDFSSFHIPAHKGLYKGAKFDLTEIPCTDDLYDSRGLISKSEVLASEIYGSGVTVFSTGGNTLCIQTMLRIAFPCGGRIIAAVNIHKSAINAMALLNIEPVWAGVYEGQNVLASTIEQAIEENPDSGAVYITSPDYFGIMSDIKKIKEVCGKIPLLVDNAHGSHLKFMNLHPLEFGADICADSAHKTLPQVLTGGALLHVKKGFCPSGSNIMVKYKDVKEAMSIFGSSSPSFLTIISLEKCMNWLKNNGKKEFEKLAKKVNKIKQNAAEYNLNILGQCLLQKKYIKDSKSSLIKTDPIRITFNFQQETETQKFLNHLYLNKIEPEFAGDKRIVLIPSPFNSKRDFDRLHQAIVSSSKLNKFKFKEHNNSKNKITFYKPKKICPKISLEEAFFSPTKRVNAEKSIGRISSRTVFKCPPGVPIVFPGEEICEHHMELMRKYKILDISVLI